MRFLLPAPLLLLAACGDGAGEPPAPPPAPRAALEVAFLRPGERIAIDGVARDEAWLRTKEVSVAAGGRTVRLRALHDGERLFLLAAWEDASLDRNRYWKLGADRIWERRRGEDGLAIAWGPGPLRGPFRETGCALFCHGGRHARPEGEGLLDVWYWGAQRTDPLGQADDLALRFGPGQSLRGDNQPADSGNVPNVSGEFEGPGYCAWRQTPEVKRELFLRNAQGLSRAQVRALSNVEGWEIPYDLLRPFAGSRGDVAARGRHDGRRWTLEMSRLLRTGHPDDEPLGDPLVPASLAVAIQDGTEGADHLVSPPIEVRFVAPS